MPIDDNGNTSGQARVKGNGSVVAYWTPPYASSYPGAPTPTPVPPATVTVRVYARASAQTSPQANNVGYQTNIYNKPVQVPSVEVNNGFGDPVTSTDNGASKSWQTSGYHLKTFDATGGSWEPDPNDPTTDPAKKRQLCKVELPLNLAMVAALTAKGSSFDRRGDGYAGAISVSVGGLEPQGDTRSVQIVRNGARGPVLNAAASDADKTKYEWVDADGTGHGHTLYSGPVWLGNEQGFSAAFQGYWLPAPVGSDPAINPIGPGVTWNWSPAATTSIDNRDGAKRTMPLESSSSNQYDLAYTAKSLADGATAKAAYKLTLHNQYEDWKDEPQYGKVRNTSWREAPNTPHITSTYDNQQLTVGVSASYTYSTGLTFTQNMEAGVVFAKVGLGLEENVSLSDTLEANASATITAPYKGWGTYLQIGDRVDIHSGTTKHWDTSGFVGEEPYALDKFVGLEHRAAPLEWRGVGPAVGDPQTPPAPPKS